MKPRLLIISFSDAARDPRVWRQAYYLRDDFQVSVTGLGDPGLDRVTWIPIQLQPARHRIHRYWRICNLLIGNPSPFQKRFALKNVHHATDCCFDIVLANDAEPLPMSFLLAKGAPVIFDAHEYYPRTFESSFKWNLFFKNYFINLCRQHIPRCAGMLTVCTGLAQEYLREFGTLPQVIGNAPASQQLPVNRVTPERIQLIHHGIASPSRKLEEMIATMDLVDSRFHLDLMLMDKPSPYLEKIKSMANERSNITLRPPVPMPEIAKTINSYDIGFYLLPPQSFNQQYALPNKFFEFIQGRLAIAIGPSPEMAAIIRKHDLGVVADDFTPQALAAKINALSTEDIMRFKHNADKAAAIYNAEAEMAKLRTLLFDVLEKRK